MSEVEKPNSEKPSTSRKSGRRQPIAQTYFDRLAANGEIPPDADSQRGREAFRALRTLLATHYQLSVDTADYRTALPTADQERFRAALAGTVLDRLGDIDTAQAGRTVTALSVGTNALRDDADRFRAAFDDLIADYLTTGRYHESHEAFVTTALLFEQFLYAMADSTTTQHDVLDDAVSSNTRILATLGRGLAYYAEHIAQLPDSSFDNIARVMHEHAEPQHIGRIVTALLTVYNRIAAREPHALPEAARRILSGLDPEVVRESVGTARGAIRAGLEANPHLARVLTGAIGQLSWTVVKSCVRSFRRSPQASRPLR
ncbi:hypothetical protein NONO_c52040 [Nocardia nova SH22a]|uniref:Uncharacterized protein n=1 Tax=Nocardia nova SH22a TaxID=1415166 RepID=W5TLZ5_9NOCA|nr:hypothetical protein [Nocardia nova]AHH19988.1 hypothetical protein NONO_c52040 [Nocardia nova SH22a]